jgi:hypothetical protein
MSEDRVGDAELRAALEEVEELMRRGVPGFQALFAAMLADDEAAICAALDVIDTVPADWTA